jgi:hypothetical protein
MKTIEIEDLIKELFEILPKHYKNNPDNSVDESEKNFRTHTHIIYPIKYTRTGNKETRISEQEAKQIFIQLLEREGYTYSVETPTLCHKYRFSGNPKPEIDNINGQSGSIDVSIYNDIKSDKPNDHILHRTSVLC